MIETRRQRVALARAFRAGGMPLAQIAARLGVSRATVRDYLLDPEGTRRRPLVGTCVCGTPIGRGARHCRVCGPAHRSRP